jgi:hypothetical protein
MPENLFFSGEVLDKYLNNRAEFMVVDEAFTGFIRHKENWYARQSGLKLTEHDFLEVSYNKIPTADGKEIIAVSPEEFKKLPTNETVYWNQYRIGEPLKLPWSWQ